jgi:mannose-6-phosphate isomerase-like protein (cupin superfamily)
MSDPVKDTRGIHGQPGPKATKVNLFETPRFFLDVHVLAPGQSQAVHRHEKEDKCWFVLSGHGVITTGGAEHRVGPGQAVWSPPGDDHAVRNDGSEELRLLVFMAPHPKPK